MADTDKIVADILAERERGRGMKHGGDTDEFDKTNTKNDWVGYACGYVGRATDKMARNMREGQTFRENMVKAAAICLAAIEAHDNGYC